MIKPHDISVVVQGPITGNPDDRYEKRLTYRCLESVHKYLPGAEVIVSTWKGSNVSGLSYDVLVESDDPGALPADMELRGRQILYNKRHYNSTVKAGIEALVNSPDELKFSRDRHRPLYNANRQIVCTKAGLLAATKPYAMKLRSDMVLTGTGFLEFFGKYNARNPSWRILKDRVVTNTYFARNPYRKYPYPFHPSDWFHFGRRDDVLNIWNIPLTPEPETSRWHDTRPHPPHDHERWAAYRYTVEQYNWLSFLRKHGEILFDHKTDLSNDSINTSELTIANNLVLVETTQLQIRFLKYAQTTHNWIESYTHGDWLRLYKKYCDNSIHCWPDLMPLQKRVIGLNGKAVNFWWRHDLGSRVKAMSPTTFRLAKKVHSLIVNPNNPDNPNPV